MAFAKVVFALIAALIGISVYYVIKEDVEEVPTLKSRWWGDKERRDDDNAIKPFKYKAKDEELQDLQARLSKTKYFKSLENSSWDYGTRPDFMKEVVEHWQKSFSWRKQEALINSFEHFKTNIDGISLHFIHAKPNVAPDTKVIPILLLHGWPGSFFEFYKVIPLLLEEQNDVAYEVVVPSLPGYGFSSPARKPGMNAAYIGLIMKKLMNRLGHSSFYIQGGDWGSSVCRNMAILFPSAIRGAHVNFWPLPAHPKHPILMSILGSIAPSLVLPDEIERKGVFPIWDVFKLYLEETGYFHIQATKPDTIGFGLNDSPAGLASYILEKFVSATVSRTDDALSTMEKRLTLDEVLTNIMIYWLTDSMPSAMRLYKEYIQSEYRDVERQPIHVPIGFALFPEEAGPPPKSWMKATCKNLVSYTKMKAGGHFAAFEQPVAFTNDVRNFVAKVEASSKS